jgi:hypothetical protein
MFANSKLSLETNLNNAKDYLKNLKEGKEENNKYNRTIDLPRNINFYKDKKTGECVGYKVNFIVNGKTHSKTICNKNITMEEKYDIALKYKEEIINTYVKSFKTSSKEDRDNPQPSS